MKHADDKRGEPLPFAVPLGWQVTAKRGPDGELLPQALLQRVGLVDDVYNILITAKTRRGKDNAALNMLLTLATRYTPEQVQFCIIDGKGLDWADWQHKAHCWHYATRDNEIKPAMELLTCERNRRLDILSTSGAKKWDSYQGDDLPLLVVYVSELLQLQLATSPKELAAWLGSELTSAAAFGIRYIISTQTATNFDTQWRGQVDLFLAGYQAAPNHDAPNTGLSTNDLKALGGIAPSELPAAAGVFTAVQGRDVATVRTSFISDTESARWLALLPDKPLQQPALAAVDSPGLVAPHSDSEVLRGLLNSRDFIPSTNREHSAPLQLAIAHSNGQNGLAATDVALPSDLTKMSVSDTLEPLPVAPELIPADEQRRILAAAREASSRRQVCLKLYEVTGGQKYTWVQQVCNAAGLLVTDKAAA
jgi:hypothetical protein